MVGNSFRDRRHASTCNAEKKLDLAVAFYKHREGEINKKHLHANDDITDSPLAIA